MRRCAVHPNNPRHGRDRHGRDRRVDVDVAARHRCRVHALVLHQDV